VDTKDFLDINKYHWTAKKTGNCIYARATINKKKIYLHIFLLGKNIGFEIDHINNNGLDNRRKNLRFCTHSENEKNRRINKNNKTGYIGVSFDKYKNKFSADIRHLNKHIFLGNFDDPKEAAKARDKYILEKGTGYEKLNF